MIEIVPNWHPILVHFTIALLTIATLLFTVTAIAGRNHPLHGIETTDLSACNCIFETRLSLRRPKPKKAFDRKT